MKQGITHVPIPICRAFFFSDSQGKVTWNIFKGWSTCPMKWKNPSLHNNNDVNIWDLLGFKYIQSPLHHMGQRHPMTIISWNKYMLQRCTCPNYEVKLVFIYGVLLKVILEVL